MKRAICLLMLLPLLAGCTIQLPGEPPTTPTPPPGPVKPVNQKPIPLFSISSRAPLTEEEVTFDATLARDEDGWIEAYLWNFGAYGIRTGSIVGLIYHEAGKHSISLTVTDNEASTSIRRYTLTVKDPDPCNCVSSCRR